MATIEPRKNKDGKIISYRIRASLGYDVNGKQIFNQMTWKPSPDMTEKQIEKELQKISALWDAECEHKQTVDGSITFSQLQQMWWESYAKLNLKKTTLSSYEKMMPSVLKAIGHLSLDKIQPHHLNEFYASLMGRMIKTNEAVIPAIDFAEYILVHDGKKQSKKRMKQKDICEKSGVSLTTLKTMIKGKPISVECARKVAKAMNMSFEKIFKPLKRKFVSVSTVRRYHAMISGVFHHAMIENIITVNPCSKIRLPKNVRKEAAYFDENEVARLLDLLETAPEPFRTATKLCIFLGLRRGELCGLDWVDVDFDRAIISVRKNVLCKAGYGMYEDTPKTLNSIRDIKVSENVLQMLRNYKEYMDWYSNELGDKWQETGKIFTNSFGGWLNPSTYSSWFSRFCQQNGFKNAHVHTLRHTSATMLIMSGIPSRVVSKRLGHNSTQVTNDIYAHVIRKADELASEALDMAIFR